MYSFIGASLSRPHTSVMALCKCVYLCLFVCLLLGPTTYHKFQMSAFKYLTIECPRTPTCIVLQQSCENEHEWLLPDSRVSVKGSESEDDCIGSMHGNLISDKTMVWSHDKAGCEWQTAECTVVRFAPGKHLAWSLIYSRDSPPNSQFDCEG